MSGQEVAEAYLQSLLKTERGSRTDLAAYQEKLLRGLVSHAFNDTPFYGSRGKQPTDLAPGSAEWLAQPFVTRRDLVANFDAFRPRSFSRLHGIIMPLSTGGSTGPAARRDMSSLESLARLLASYRMFHGWQLDQSRPFFVLRKTERKGEAREDRWGFPWRDERERGKRIWIDIAVPAAEQLQMMAGQGPVYVNTLPSNILRLSVEALRSGIELSIPFIVSVGEYLAPEVRAAAKRAFGSTVIDAFSSAEGGVIAIQCPEAGVYHIQSEQVLAEIISPEGQPCVEGQVGEVIVTPLYGYATPLLRYRSGDYVEAGPVCSCGRVLPAITRIVGRREHMFDLPNGTRQLPGIDRVLITQELGHDRWALVQRPERTAVFRHAGTMTSAARRRVTESVDAALGGGFRVLLEEVADLPLTSGGKRHFTLNEMPQESS